MEAPWRRGSTPLAHLGREIDHRSLPSAGITQIRYQGLPDTARLSANTTPSDGRTVDQRAEGVNAGNGPMLKQVTAPGAEPRR